MEKPEYAQFYSFSELEHIILDAAAEYPDFMRVESLAVTAEGRHFYLITLSDFADGVDPDAGRDALGRLRPHRRASQESRPDSY